MYISMYISMRVYFHIVWAKVSCPARTAGSPFTHETSTPLGAEYIPKINKQKFMWFLHCDYLIVNFHKKQKIIIIMYIYRI